MHDAEDSLGLLREVAGLYESRINDKAKASIAIWQHQAGARRRAEPGGHGARGASHLALGRRDRRYSSAVLTADEERDVPTANALRLRLGRVYVEEAKRVDDALAEYRAVYESDPDNQVALGALESLYRQTQRWRDLLDVYEKKRELANQPEERSASCT